MEKLRRDKNVVIVGMKEEENENLESQEKAVTALFENIGVRGALVDDCRRLGRKVEGRNTRPMLVKFVRMLDKRKVLGKKKNLGRERIFINEDLTIEERKTEKILRDHFKGLHEGDRGLKMGIRDGKMTIWKNNSFFKKVQVGAGGAVEDCGQRME